MKILMQGDSWGCGEYNGVRHNYDVTHPGLEKYLVDYGFDVKNSSQGNNSNSVALEKLFSEQLEDYDNIIWFQTDPIRDLRPYHDFKARFTTIGELLYFKRTQLQQTYQQLNSAGKKILCIGGCSKLDLELIKEFENLTPVIESVIEMLIPGYEHPELWFGDYFHLIGNQFDLESLDVLIHHKHLIDNLVNYPEYFSPDREHPNRLGHRRIFEIVLDYLK